MIIQKEADKENDKNTDGGIVYGQILIYAKFRTGKRGQTTELTGRRTLRRRRSAQDCSAM